MSTPLRTSSGWREAGVARFVYISAAPVVPDGPVVGLRERDAGTGLPSALYPKTKAIAERAVLAADAEGFRTIALRPPAVWGPDNHHMEEVYERARAGKWRWIGGSHQTLSTIHVANLAEAVRCALASERGGEAYFVTDADQRPMRETFGAILRARGIEPGDQELPRVVAVAMAHVLGGAWRLLGLKSRPPVAPLMIRLMATEFSVDDA